MDDNVLFALWLVCLLISGMFENYIVFTTFVVLGISSIIFVAYYHDKI